MEIRDWFIIIFTFVVGILSGFYLYVTVYQPIYDPDTSADGIATIGDLSIIGVTYGGFTPRDYIHPSFKIKADGTYDYFAGGTTQLGKSTGTLPDDYFAAIEEAISNADLLTLAARAVNKNCASFADGLEYEYTIDVGGQEFVLDTCLTQFENSSELGRILGEMWGYAESPDQYNFSISVTNMPGSGSNNLGRDDVNTWTLRSFFENGFKDSGFDTKF